MRRRFVNGRKERRKRRRVEKEQPTMIGKIVDLPLEDFEKELVRQKVNIGTINNLILNLEGVYYELRTRKDEIINIGLWKYSRHPNYLAEIIMVAVHLVNL